MALNVRFDPRAVDDLRDIRDYLLSRSPQGAENVRRHIEATIDRLAIYPRLGRQTDADGVRILVLTRYPYLIFYTALESDLVVLHIRHGARREIDPSELAG